MLRIIDLEAIYKVPFLHRNLNFYPGLAILSQRDVLKMKNKIKNIPIDTAHLSSESLTLSLKGSQNLFIGMTSPEFLKQKSHIKKLAQKDTNIAYELARVYDKGLYNQQINLYEAAYWYDKAMNLSPQNAKAFYNLSALYLREKPAGLPKGKHTKNIFNRARDQRLAISNALMEVAADLGHFKARNMLATRAIEATEAERAKQHFITLLSLKKRESIHIKSFQGLEVFRSAFDETLPAVSPRPMSLELLFCLNEAQGHDVLSTLTDNPYIRHIAYKEDQDAAVAEKLNPILEKNAVFSGMPVMMQAERLKLANASRQKKNLAQFDVPEISLVTTLLTQLYRRYEKENITDSFEKYLKNYNNGQGHAISPVVLENMISKDRRFKQ